MFTLSYFRNKKSPPEAGRERFGEGAKPVLSDAAGGVEGA